MGIVISFDKDAVVDGCGEKTRIAKNGNEKKIPCSACVFLALNVSESLKDVFFVFSFGAFAIAMNVPIEIEWKDRKIRSAASTSIV